MMNKEGPRFGGFLLRFAHPLAKHLAVSGKNAIIRRYFFVATSIDPIKLRLIGVTRLGLWYIVAISNDTEPASGVRC